VEKRKGGGFVQIQDALESYLRSAGIAKGRGNVARVFEAWTTAVGRDLAKRARPVRLRQGELTVEVDSSALLHELTCFTGDAHRKRINEILQRPAVHRVIFKQRG
jgi:hypothetical protein